MANEYASSEGQSSPDGKYATSGDRSSAHTVKDATASGKIPRIVILDENAVYDHYMRRLNRVWMRRIKVGAAPTPGYPCQRSKFVSCPLEHRLSMRDNQ